MEYHRETHGSDIDNLSAIIHLIVLSAEQVILLQQDSLNSASSLRVLSADSIALLHTMLSTTKGMYADVSATSTSILKMNNHEQMQYLRMTPATTGHIIEITSTACPNTLKLADLPPDIVVPPVYRKDIISPAVVNCGHRAAPFSIIVDNAATNLMSIVDAFAVKRVSNDTTSASKRISVVSPATVSTASVEAAMREDRAMLLTQAIIHVARWTTYI